MQAQPAAKTAPEIREMTFERANKELEQIVARLERGDVALEESIAIFERGDALREHCERLLKQAEAKVEKLILNRSGEPVGTEPFRAE
jgi:exodeoxyribonuclease VII small subunit